MLAVPNVCGADVMRTSNFALKPIRLTVFEATEAEIAATPKTPILRSQRTPKDFRNPAIKADRALVRDPDYVAEFVNVPLVVEEVAVALTAEEAEMLDGAAPARLRRRQRGGAARHSVHLVGGAVSRRSRERRARDRRPVRRRKPLSRPGEGFRRRSRRKLYTHHDQPPRPFLIRTKALIRGVDATGAAEVVEGAALHIVDGRIAKIGDPANLLARRTPTCRSRAAPTPSPSPASSTPTTIRADATDDGRALVPARALAAAVPRHAPRRPPPRHALCRHRDAGERHHDRAAHPGRPRRAGERLGSRRSTAWSPPMARSACASHGPA